MARFWTIIQLLIHLWVCFWSCGMKMLHGIWYKLEVWIKRYLIQTYLRLSQEYFKSYKIAYRVALWLDVEQLSSYLFISGCLFRAAISKCYMEFDIILEDWINRYRIQTYHRLSQDYFKSYRIAFSVALWLDFEQLSSYLFVYRRLFGVAVWKFYMEFDTKLEDWIKRYLIQTYHRLSQKYFKSYRIALRVALWLDFEQLSSYLFISRCLCRAAISKCYMEFDTKLEDWINRYLIQTYHRLSQEYFKSYIIAFSVALWLDFKQLSSYLFVYRRFYRAAISKCYMEFDTKLEDWIKRYLIQTYHSLSQKYFKSYRIAFRVALWLDFEQWSSYLFFSRCHFPAAISKCYMEFDTNWRIESRDILFELTTGYLKSISSHIE